MNPRCARLMRCDCWKLVFHSNTALMEETPLFRISPGKAAFDPSFFPTPYPQTNQPTTNQRSNHSKKVLYRNAQKKRIFPLWRASALSKILLWTNYRSWIEVLSAESRSHQLQEASQRHPGRSPGIASAAVVPCLRL